jgi:hypothetical protein
MREEAKKRKKKEGIIYIEKITKRVKKKRKEKD